MATKTVNWKMKQRQGTASQWASKNPVLAAGEFGYDTTNDVVKIGDGKTAWSSLPSFRKKKYDLDSMSWSEISQIARAGRAPMLFNIGDEKTITLSTGEKITLVILDFWHDYYYDADNDEDVPAGITFGLKNCLATRYQMNASNTNVGGWESSKMRTSVMATLLSQLPSDLQNVIIEVKKRTSAGNKSTAIRITSDKLFLLSEVEVDGTTAATYANEGKQYLYFMRNNAYEGDYYGNPNYVKGLSNGDGASSAWWLRSPYVADAGIFRCVGRGGDVTGSYANDSVGVSFGFCV